MRTVTQAQIDKAMMPMVYSGGVVMLGVLLLLWANVIAFIVIAAGAFAFHHYSKERDALVRAQRSTPTRQPDMRVPHDLASLYAPPYASLQRQSDPQVEAIKAITSLEMAKLNHAHDSQMRDKDHGHDETIVRLNNKTQVDLTHLSTDAQLLVAKEEGFTQREVARFQALGADRDFARQKEMIELHQEHDLEKMEKEHTHQSTEAEKDRQATIEQMITRFEGKIKEVETRMEYESPNANKRSQEELITLRGRMAQMKEINKIPDSTQRKQMFDQFKRGWS